MTNQTQLHAFDPIDSHSTECECGLLWDAEIHSASKGEQGAPERIWLYYDPDAGFAVGPQARPLAAFSAVPYVRADQSVAPDWNPMQASIEIKDRLTNPFYMEQPSRYEIEAIITKHCSTQSVAGVQKINDTWDEAIRVVEESGGEMDWKKHEMRIAMVAALEQAKARSIAAAEINHGRLTGDELEERKCVACGKPSWAHSCDRPTLGRKFTAAQNQNQEQEHNEK